MTLDELKEIVAESVKNALIEYQKHNKKEEDDRLMSITDVTRLLGVSKVTITKWKRDGLIPSHRLSRRVYFKKKEVMEALQEARFGYRKRNFR